MTKTRMEGLLASFTKLISSRDQQTFTETESPLEELYIVLITNKNSNILQDIDTLSLFSRIVSEHCKSSDQKEVIRQRFELILVFDEIKTIATMESNDERIQAEIQKRKEREAKDESKRRAQAMDLKKREQMQQARKSIHAESSSQSLPFKSTYNTPIVTYNTPVPSAYLPPSAPTVGRGMQLGKKSAQASLFETIKQEEGVREVAQLASPPALSPKGHGSISKDSLVPAEEESVHIAIEEKISATANRDGGLQSLEVNGTMMLKVNDPLKAKIILQLAFPSDSNLQFKTHPNVDKQLWASGSVIALRDTNRPFPVSQPLGILKWRYASKDETQLPLLGKGTCDVTIEYEFQSSRLQLENLVIAIPFKGQVTQPGTSGTGTCVVDRTTQSLSWIIPEVDQRTNSSGLLEFSIDSEDVSILYPIKVHFKSKKFIDMTISTIKMVEGGVQTPFSSDYSLVTEDYEIA